MNTDDFIINFNESILITGANGFIGTQLVKVLLKYGFNKLICLVRPESTKLHLLQNIKKQFKSKIKLIEGDLLSKEICKEIIRDASLIYNLAAGKGKTFSKVYNDSVIGTKNLLEAVSKKKSDIRFLQVSSFTVYSTSTLKSGELLDELCAVEKTPQLSDEAYAYAKIKQEELVYKYGEKYKIPFVIVRPGSVYGPGIDSIPGRVGIKKYGVFLHLGGSNQIPFTYVDNCADAIALAGLKKGVENEAFNIVDDNLPSSINFLKMYMKNVEKFNYISVPKQVSYFLCYFVERFSSLKMTKISHSLNRKRWNTDWKGNQYTNEKIKRIIEWQPKISCDEGLRLYFEYCKRRNLYD